MKWEDYYDRFYDWPDDTQAKLFPLVEKLGPADEVVDVIQSLGSYRREAADRAARKVLDEHIALSGDHIYTLSQYVSEEVLEELIVRYAPRFTKKDLEAVLYATDEYTLADIYKKRELRLPECLRHLDEDDEADSADAGEDGYDAPIEERPVGFLARLAGLFAADAALRKVSGNGKRAFRVGDRVRVKYRGQEGTVIDVNGELYMVSLMDGRYVDSYTAEQLEKVR